MRLKKIKLAGFKSFVDPTNIPFPGDMTAVVGPNGCGKSNVIDAVRWVLGESSAKNLRGDAMTDVIFNGSTGRKAVSQCSVELVFDNSSGRIGGEYAIYNELSVKRIVTKDAISTYHLNGAKCRRRDITDLFLGTGLGPRSYAIIEQGMISKLIESKPQELRVFIEEAAGISKYKERRRETENRIKHTNENLERLDDVRNELGQQLNKLQRQAAAATKFTQLKATERELKAQLAAFRWLQQSQKLSELEHTISQLQNELASVLSKQSADQNEIIHLREKQADTKQSVSDNQQQLFSLGTDITKIEQSQIFTSKRKQQIQTEVGQLQQTESEISATLVTVEEALASASANVVSLAPNKMLIEETIEQAELERENAQQAVSDLNYRTKESQEVYQALKQKMQSCHSQIESTLSLQSRTQTRINELREELSTQSVDDLDAILTDLEEQIQTYQQDKISIDEQIGFAKKELDKALSKVSKCDEQIQLMHTRIINSKAKHSALLDVQNGDIDASYIDIPQLSIEPLWQYLNVKEGYESLFEGLLKTWLVGMDKASVIHDLSVTQLPKEFWQLPQHGVVYLSSCFTSEKRTGTVAELLNNEKVPALFNHLHLTEDIMTVSAQLAELEPCGCVVSFAGQLISHDYAVNGIVSKNDGSITRSIYLEKLVRQIEIDEAELDVVLAQQDTHKRESEQAALNFQTLGQNANQITQQLYELNVRKTQKQEQRQYSLKRVAKINDDILNNELSLAQEEEKLANLSDQIECDNEALIVAEEKVADVVHECEQLNYLIDQHRNKVNELTARKHQIELQVQQANNEFTALSEKQSLINSQIAEITEKLALLAQEREELEMPSADQQAKLSLLFEQKQRTLALQTELQEQLNMVEEKLLIAEKGQTGIAKVSDKIKTQIDSERLLAEGCKVRAESFIVQLNDMEKPLKPILEELPENISESKWQSDLEQTQTAVLRLGAVNLAAVKEYEQQAQRKNHLDTQNDDLRQALDILQTAIRKIDKETRTRFRHTFDQVNADLKMLFPKVFGGGIAYLELTDDDLLDTGVTIMARPPGKKNSTIHLLSGGEKALTALSLVFAIFRLNPAPFCLLDEVDAPLDDANVGRFCNLVSEMSKTVQFIYITHNKVAMEMATHLTGVTMAEPGVSRMVAVDIEEAIAIAE